MDKRKRNLQIYKEKRLINPPATYRELGLKYGLSRERIQRIVKDIEIDLKLKRLEELEKEAGQNATES